MDGKYYVRFGRGFWIRTYHEPGDMRGSYEVGDSGAFDFINLGNARRVAVDVGGEVVRRVPKGDYTYEVVRDD